MAARQYLLVRHYNNRNVILGRYRNRDLAEQDLEWITQFETKAGARNYKIISTIRRKQNERINCL